MKIARTITYFGSRSRIDFKIFFSISIDNPHSFCNNHFMAAFFNFKKKQTQSQAPGQVTTTTTVTRQQAPNAAPAPAQTYGVQYSESVQPAQPMQPVQTTQTVYSAQQPAAQTVYYQQPAPQVAPMAPNQSMQTTTTTVTSRQSSPGTAAPSQSGSAPQTVGVSAEKSTQGGTTTTKTTVTAEKSAPGAAKPAGTGAAAGSAAAAPMSDATKEANKEEELDLMTHLTQRSNRVFILAQQKAKELKNQFIDSEHVLCGLIADPEIYKILVDFKIQPKIVEQELEKVYRKEAYPAAPTLSPRVKRIIDLSLVAARQLGYEFIAPEHILVALVEEGEGAGARVLAKLGLKKEDLNKKIIGRKEAIGEKTSTTDHKSALEEFTIDLTAKAAKGLLDPVVERSEVIERVIHILSRRTKNNPSLVGEAGVGKTAIVEGLAQKIAEHKVPETLMKKRILQLDLMAILAGASHRGEFEQRMKSLIEEVQQSKGSIILFIDEIHNIVGAGGGGDGAMDASNFLKPSLARGELQLIGATTLTEYRKYIEKDPALERRFQPVLVPEPTEEAAIKMLQAIKGKYEAFHRVTIPEDALEEAVKMSKRYVGDRFLPDKAVDLIDEAASAVRLPLLSLPEEIQSLETRIAELGQEAQEAGKTDKVRQRILNSKADEVKAELSIKKEEFEMKKAQTTTSVSVQGIHDIVSRWTGIPVNKLTGSEVEKLAHLEDIIHARMIDQEEAVGVVAQAVRRGRAGLKSAHRPIGSFVFLGPTGVGKTELAKTLAEVLFGQEEAMIRLDMTEFMEKHEVAKLLGAPPGYVGYEEGGKLTEAVRRKPYSVVLFDEIEKAHADIFNILLQILDDGRLTDNKGHVISFKNTVIICTSNIGSKVIQDALLAVKKPTKKEIEAIKEKVMNELRKFFRPELINRFDEVTVFEPLTYENVAKIVRLQLKEIEKLLEDQDMGMSVSDRAVEEIAKVGFDPVYGARPLQRTIQRLIENPISTLIIKQQLKAGDVVKVDFDGKEFTFNVGKGQLLEVEEKPEFLCGTCSKKFKTEVVKNATTICPFCASSTVKRIESSEKKEEEKKDGEKKESDKKEGDAHNQDSKDAAGDMKAGQEKHENPADSGAPLTPAMTQDSAQAPVAPGAGGAVDGAQYGEAGMNGSAAAPGGPAIVPPPEQTQPPSPDSIPPMPPAGAPGAASA